MTQAFADFRPEVLALVVGGGLWFLTNRYAGNIDRVANVFSGIFLYLMVLLNVGPDRGWFSYVPLAGPEFGIGKRPDVWAQLVTAFLLLPQTPTSVIVFAVLLLFLRSWRSAGLAFAGMAAAAGTPTDLSGWMRWQTG